MKETSKPSRRSYLTALSAAYVAGVSGCLRLADSGGASEPTTAQRDDRTAAAETDRTPAASSAIEESWTLSKWGSDIVTFDGTFYASTWVSKQLYALEPDGTVQWKTDEVGKFKGDSLAVTDSVVVGCAYGGQVTAFDRETGEVRWNFTDGEYDQWSTEPLVTDRYVVAANLVDDAEEDQQRVYVLDLDSGDVVNTVAYPDTDFQVGSLGTVNGRLFIASWNSLELHSLDSHSKVASYDEGLFDTCYVRNGDIFTATDDNVYRYAVDDAGITQKGGVSLRGSIYDAVFTDDGVVASGAGGLFKVSLDGAKEWWAKTEGAASRATLAGDAVVAMDEFLQLYAFDAESGDRIGTVKLPSEGSMAPVSSIGSVVLTAVKPFTAFEVG